MEKVVLLTGGTSGIGKELAYLYAKNGYNLLIIARDKNCLDNIKSLLEKEYNIKVYTYSIDLSLKESAKLVYDYTKQNNLIVDILINNAGFGDFGLFIESNLKKQSSMIDLNIKTLVDLCYYFSNEMKNNNYGKILNVASLAGFMPGPYMGVYYATKAFVLSFSESLSAELKQYNIKVSALCPGPTKTNFEKNANVKFSKVNMYTPKFVAKYAYKKFMKSRKVVILPGLYNKFMSILPKLFPRFVIRNVVGKLQRSFRKK